MFLIFIAVIATVIVVASLTKEEYEDWYGAKILGYALLGAVYVGIHTEFGHYWLPFGFPLALFMARSKTMNWRAKRFVALIGFVGLIATAFVRNL